MITYVNPRLPAVMLPAVMLLAVVSISVQARDAVVADSQTHAPLAHASVFDHRGRPIGTCLSDGRIVCASPADYPITIRYMGFRERTVAAPGSDTIFLQERMTSLPEVVVEARQKKMLHILAYLREYSTLATYTDTVTLFREKMIDFMLPDGPDVSYRGWRMPRVISSKSYYRFTNAAGLDSVSDRSGYHFTWSDWIGMLRPAKVAAGVAGAGHTTDTIRGRYSPAEVWVRNDDRLTLDVDVLADTACRRWVPGLSSFFKNENIDFEQFRLRLNYDNVTDDVIGPIELTGYSFGIETRGRGHGMFRFNRRDEPFFVTTYTEVYILDKKYITVKEARKWERNKPADEDIGVYASADAPPLQPSVLDLIARVEAIDHDGTRLSLAPDRRLMSKEPVRRSFEQAVMQRIKSAFGIDHLIGRRKQKRNWKEFFRKQLDKNRQRALPDSIAFPQKR